MIPAKLQAVLDDLAMFPDRSERIEALIAYSEEYKLPSQEELVRTPECQVQGCESQVYIGSRPLGEGLEYVIAVDNPQGISSMALAVILQTGLNGARLEEVAEVPEEVVYEIFGRELSMGKSMGLTGTVSMVKAEAAKHRKSR